MAFLRWSNTCCGIMNLIVFVLIVVLELMVIGSSSSIRHMPPSWYKMCQTEVSGLKSHKASPNVFGLGTNGGHSRGHFDKPTRETENVIQSLSRTTGAPEEITSTPEYSVDTKMVKISCTVPKSHDVHWKLMDLHVWEIENGVNLNTDQSSRTLVFAISVECETGANISLPWPMKSEGLREVRVRNCGLVDQFSLASSPLVSEIPDELEVLEIRDSFWLVDLTSRNEILDNSNFDFININSDYDCGQDESLQVYISSNVTLASHVSFNMIDVNKTDDTYEDESSNETVNALISQQESTTRKPVRPEDRLVTDQESLISDHRGMSLDQIPGLEDLILAENKMEKSDTNLTASQDFLELLKKIKNTRIKCDFVKLRVRDESMTSETPKHLLQVSTQDATHPVLEMLNYSRINMKKFPRELSQWRLYFPRLRYLDLSYNYISELEVEDYPLMPDSPTTIMNIRHNNLSVISPDILKRWASVENFHVDFRNNPISCHCEIKSMIPFLRNASTFTGQMAQYEYIKDIHCSSPSFLSGRKLSSLSESSISCPTAESSRSLVIALVILLAMFVIVTIVLIRFKVEIRILLYTRLHIRLPCDSDAYRRNKIYDAFVSYSNEDSAWVLEHLVNYLEKGVGDEDAGGEKISSGWKKQMGRNHGPFKLCLHQRDFIPGKTIVDNIIDCIEASRHTIIVLSTNFMRSHWAMEELRQAYKQSLVEKTRHLIVLLLEKVPSEDTDPLIQRCVKTFTYLQVQDSIFRDKLIFSLSTKDKATRRRDRILASKQSHNGAPPPSKADVSAAHDNFTYVHDPTDHNKHGGYENIQLPDSYSLNKNEIFQPSRSRDITHIETIDSCYYTLEVPPSNSVTNEYENMGNPYNDLDTITDRPNGPSRILSNTSTSSTTALTWNL